MRESFGPRVIAEENVARSTERNEFVPSLLPANNADLRDRNFVDNFTRLE